MADVSNLRDCIIENLRSEIKGVQEKESIMDKKKKESSIPLTLMVDSLLFLSLMFCHRKNN